MRADFLRNWRSYVKIRNQAIVGIKFTDRREQLICGLFSRVDGLSQEVIKLLKSEGSLGCPPMMRSALESYIDLKCLKKDEKYVYEFEAMHVDSQIKYYKAYSDENIWFKKMALRRWVWNSPPELGQNMTSTAAGGMTWTAPRF